MRRLPRPVSLDFQVQRDAEQYADRDNDPEHHHALQRRPHGDGVNDVSGDEEFQAQENRPPDILTVTLVALDRCRLAAKQKTRGRDHHANDDHEHTKDFDQEPDGAHEFPESVHGTPQWPVAKLHGRTATMSMSEPDEAGVDALRELIARLTAEGAFGPPATVSAPIETHISIIVLGAHEAWKFKKPLNLGFLDFSRLELREAACARELELNRRLLPEFYLGVRSVGGARQAPRFDASPTLEVCVHMRRFPGDAELPRALAEARVDAPMIRRLGRELADFQANCDAVIAGSGAARALAGHCEDNFTVIEGAVQEARLHTAVRAVAAATRAQLARHAGLLDARQRAGRVRRGHGDLHAGNLLLLEGQIRVFDCIEFSETLRTGDVLNDIAFALMDFTARGYPALSAELLDAWLERSGDYAALPLLPLFIAYRAMVRAKVAALDDGPEARRRLGQYLALAEETLRVRPGTLILTHGLSGSGKSTLAATLVGATGAVRVRTDVERRRLLTEQAPGLLGSDAGYTAAWTSRTYARVAAACREVIAAGRPAIADATFLRRRERRAFLELGRHLGVAVRILDCQAPDDVLRVRLEARNRAGHDASEADLRVLAQQQRDHEPLEPAEQALAIRIDTRHPPDGTALAARLGLRLLAPRG